MRIANCEIYLFAGQLSKAVSGMSKRSSARPSRHRQIGGSGQRGGARNECSARGIEVHIAFGVVESRDARYYTPLWYVKRNDAMSGTDKIKRLNRVAGQVRGVAQMIEDDRYCIDVLH